MDSATIRLVLLISLAHALVHVFELALPSVEQLIADDYTVGKGTMGLLSNCWRLPYGLGALLAGWLVDRYGAKWLLVIYVVGCGGASAAVYAVRMVWGVDATGLRLLFLAMFAMGALASIYHPAGLTLISLRTTAVERPRALGLHGILGSLGIGSAPFVAGVVLLWAPWQAYFLVLAGSGLMLGVVLARKLDENDPHGRPRPPREAGPGHVELRAVAWLMLSSALLGFVYAGVLTFLPRYLGGLSIRPELLPDRSFRNYLAGGVLLVGMFGQYFGGRIALPEKLTTQLGYVMGLLVPLLVSMAIAVGNWRLLAAAAVSFVLFMHQPLYNSALADLIPTSRRSMGYGISTALSFGVGSFGATFAGLIAYEQTLYLGFAAFAATASAAAFRSQRARP